MGISEAELEQLLRNTGKLLLNDAGVSRAPHPQRAAKPQPVEVPINGRLVLYGHCPSKKNMWERREAGRMVLPKEVKEQIDTLTTQALFGWKYPGPVESPDITVRFFVAAKRQDQDGMYTTILDCLQAAGVLVNDNIAHNNGRKILEPCEFVDASDERGEIIIVSRHFRETTKMIAAVKL